MHERTIDLSKAKELIFIDKIDNKGKTNLRIELLINFKIKKELI